MQLPFIDDINLVALVSLPDDYGVDIIGLLGHSWDQFWCIFVVEVLKQEKGLKTEQDAVIDRGAFDDVRDLVVIKSVMRAVDLATDGLSLFVPTRFRFFLLNNFLCQHLFLLIAFRIRSCRIIR